jgi:DNA (cytosine-5)-methyltransferase 1
MKEYRIASLFGGIGGIDLGFEQAGAKSVWANEIDKNCAITFKSNHKDTELVVDDICNIKGKDIPKIDILVGGFPCQPFSVAGYRKGFEDNRGNMFFEIIRLIHEMEKNNNKPKVVFLENVKNLYRHDKGRTYAKITSELEDMGYAVDSRIMNSAEYGNVPQNRERIFIVAFLNKDQFNKFKWPSKIKLTNTLNKLIDRDSLCDIKYYYQDDKKCYELLRENMKSKSTIYQYRRVYVRENKSNLCPTLTANMGMGGHNVPLILDNSNRIRKLTPRECLLLQGFPKQFVIPENLSDSSIYKQAGNAVTVSVIKNVAKEIIKALED